MTCRLCGVARTKPVLSLGNVFVSDFPRDWRAPHRYAPLDLEQCQVCGLVQLTETVPREELFGHEYWYRSGLNELMRCELADIARHAVDIAQPKDGELVVDIGANDGTLLQQFPNMLPTVAFEPSPTFSRALASLTEDHRRWFPDEAKDLPDGCAAIVTSIAMFYDVDAPNAFCAEVARILRYGGVWVAQFQDLRQVVEANAFDDICHEHLCYYSLGTFNRLLARHGLHVVSADVRPINGGSLRCYVQHRGCWTDRSVERLRALEGHLDVELEEFSRRVPVVAATVKSIVQSVGGPVDVYGASTKGNTLLAVCGLDWRHLRRVLERSEAKVGRYYGATGIPIVSEEEGRRGLAAAWLVPIWQFREQVIAREQPYLAAGGRLIFPLPTPSLVSAEASV